MSTRELLENDNDLLNEFSARVWAERFVERVLVNPTIATDVGTMTAWFAGAIMTGHDTGVKLERDRRVQKDQEVWIKPYQPVTPKYPEPVAQCSACGLELHKVMGYVCSRANCPTGLGGRTIC